MCITNLVEYCKTFPIKFKRPKDTTSCPKTYLAMRKNKKDLIHNIYARSAFPIKFLLKSTISSQSNSYEKSDKSICYLDEFCLTLVKPFSKSHPVQNDT